MDEEEVVRKHFAKIGSKGGKAGTGKAKRRKGSEEALKQYWEDVKAGRREPPKRLGRPRKTSKQLADKQPASQAAPVETVKPIPEKPKAQSQPARPRKTSKQVAYKRTTYAEEMDKAISSGDVEKVIELRTGWKADPKIGRNNPCPCGSGKKFKKCCGA